MGMVREKGTYANVVTLSAMLRLKLISTNSNVVAPFEKLESQVVQLPRS